MDLITTVLERIRSERIDPPKPREIEEDIHIEASVGRLEERPELCVLLMTALNAWNDVEDELALIFATASGAEPTVAANVLRNLVAVRQKRKVIAETIGLRYGEEWRTGFRQACKVLDAAAELRNEIAHSLWYAHDSYPGSLIRFNGITDPNLGMQEYTRADCLQACACLRGLQLGLQEFALALSTFPVSSDAAVESGRGWRAGRRSDDPSPHLDTLIDHPAAQSKPVPRTEAPPRSEGPDQES